MSKSIEKTRPMPIPSSVLRDAQKDLSYADRLNTGNVQRLSNGRLVPTMKQAIFVREYVANKGNGTQAALKAYDIPMAETDDKKTRLAKLNTARGVAYDNLRKPYLREQINALFEKNGLFLDNTINEHKKIIQQDIDLPTKLKAVSEHYNIVGLRPEEGAKPAVNVALVVNNSE